MVGAPRGPAHRARLPLRLVVLLWDRFVAAARDDTDQLDLQGRAYADRAEVLLLGGKLVAAAAAFEHALARYERKGNLVMAQRVRA